MNNKEKDILAMFSELNSMLYGILDENNELKKEVAWFKKYTDMLLEHKDMVCLPADLKNLREANAALATENEELKKKVKELTRPEPTEEELNSLFMDKQTFPDPDIKDKRDMYLNPEGHVGGKINTKKDIEFEAEMLVKSVQDYADSLTNKPNAEKLVKSVKDYTDSLNNKPKLKSLIDYNDSKLTNVFGVNSTNSGFACPICTSELVYTNPNLMLTSHPPKREVRCNNCKHTDYVY